VPLFGQVTALGQIRKAAQIEEHTSLLPFVVVTKIKTFILLNPGPFLHLKLLHIPNGVD